MTGSNPKIFGYRLIGEIVPEVRITDGKDFQMGCIDKEQSRQDKVRTGSAMLPSIG